MQPLPIDTERSQPVESHVLAELQRMISERTAKGIETYGKPLSTFNGRDAGQDLLEEIADAFQYAMQLNMEIDRLRLENNRLGFYESLWPAYEQIGLERMRQDEEWGGDAHDDAHRVGDWLEFIRKQCNLIGDGLEPAENARERFVKIGALAVAAIQSIDRKAQPETIP
jgi:hypothetical protein